MYSRTVFLNSFPCKLLLDNPMRIYAIEVIVSDAAQILSGKKDNTTPSWPVNTAKSTLNWRSFGCKVVWSSIDHSVIKYNGKCTMNMRIPFNQNGK